jgi:hypothetical protein
MVSITTQVLDLLEYLIRERIVSKGDLIASIWAGRIVSDSALATRINAARCAIDDSGAEQRLRFVGVVHEKQKPEVVIAAGAAAGPPEHFAPAGVELLARKRRTTCDTFSRRQAITVSRNRLRQQGRVQ